jgi:hypothetical protein
MTGPVETKTAAHASAAAVTGVITWALVQFVPYFHAGLPGPLATFLPFAVSGFLGAAAGFLAPHTPRPDIPPPAHARP